MSKSVLKFSTDITNRLIRKENFYGMLVGFDRDGMALTLHFELPEYIADECIDDLREMLERWERRARGEP